MLIAAEMLQAAELLAAPGGEAVPSTRAHVGMAPAAHRFLPSFVLPRLLWGQGPGLQQSCPRCLLCRYSCWDWNIWKGITTPHTLLPGCGLS